MASTNRWAEKNPRKAALDFLVRYWGLTVMHKEKSLAHIPLLEFEEKEWEDDEQHAEEEA